MSLRSSHHYHMLTTGWGVIEHEHLAHPGRPHIHATGEQRDPLGPSSDTFPLPPQLRGEGHRSWLRTYRAIPEAIARRFRRPD